MSPEQFSNAVLNWYDSHGYDIDITHRQYATARGLAFRRLSSLNAGETFIRALKNIVNKSTVIPA